MKVSYWLSALLVLLSLSLAPALATASVAEALHNNDARVASSSAATSTCKALLVGLNYYQAGSQSWERWWINATAMRDALLTWNCWRNENIKLLGPNVTGQQIISNLNTMTVGPSDTFIFYYSGHGSFGLENTPGDRNEAAPAVNKRDEWLFASITPGRVTDDDLCSCFNRSNFNRSATKIVILDSCYSGGFWNGTDEGDLEKISNIAVLASAPEDKMSPASSDLTKALVKGMTKGASGAPADANHDGTVTASEWFAYAKSQVPVGPVFGYRKQGEELYENFTEMNWTYNEPVSSDTNGALDSPVSFPPPHLDGGGISIAVDKLALLAPSVTVASLITAATVAIALNIKRVRRRKEKR